ncbi:MAG: LON peptidase substrate-binding domain-containing protein [Cocleimonas sp.]
MRSLSPFTQTFDKLPNTLPVFPLTNAVVMPGGQLPLNIFEARYLNMIQDAMDNHRLIGMVQPRTEGDNPELYNIGCAARITRYEETNDGRIEISLMGLCRFDISEELITTRGYRLIVPNWSKYEIDYEKQEEPDSATQFTFMNTLRSHFKQTNMDIDWKIMEKLSTESLFNALFYFLDLSDEDKQMLIEMDTLNQRIKTITAILDGNSQVIPTHH